MKQATSSARRVGGLLSAIVFACLVWAARADAPAEPELPVPQGARSFPMGERLTVNGTPMRLLGFITDQPVGEVLAWYRRRLGSDVVEDGRGSVRTIARMEAGRYLMVELEPAANGTRGVLTVTDLEAALLLRYRQQSASREWLARMPAGSRLLSDVASEDGDRHARHRVFANTLQASLNADRLKDWLNDEGYALERESIPGEAGMPLPPDVAEGRALYFKGQGKEAIGVVVRDMEGQTTIVLNTIVTMETYR